jgi:SAM-dependent methyltransferase
VIAFPSVDEWFQLTRRYPAFKKASISTLKDYGVMRCMQYVEDNFAHRGKDCRILEFGHGFNPVFLQRFQDKHEVWGADRDQELPYFGPNFDWERRFKAEMAPHTKNVTFVRELVSKHTENSKLPTNHFDVIASVSVLEEVTLGIVEDVLGAAFDKLRPGGVLIGTHDMRIEMANERMPAYIGLHQKIGYEIESLPTMPNINVVQLLVENPTAVMIWYQGGVPEEARKFWGHWGTCFTVARKPF